jgi:hypothetical protein
MSAMRAIVRRIYHAIPLAPRLRLWLSDRIGTAVRGGAGASAPGPDLAAQRAWLQKTITVNRQERAAAQERLLAGPERDAALRAQKLRAGDLEDYLRLGGRKPPR